MTSVSLLPSSPSSSSRRPCRYQIRERILTLGNTFKIKDEVGCDQYVVRSKVWTWGQKVLLEDTNGNVLMKIRQKGFHLLDQYQIFSACTDQPDQTIATIRQKLTFFKHCYKIYSIYGEYQLKGLNIFDHSFTLKKKSGQIIAIVNKKFFSMADSYGVEILEPEDHAFILALVIVLHCSLYGS